MFTKSRKTVSLAIVNVQSGKYKITRIYNNVSEQDIQKIFPLRDGKPVVGPCVHLLKTKKEMETEVGKETTTAILAAVRKYASGSALSAEEELLILQNGLKKVA